MRRVPFSVRGLALLLAALLLTVATPTLGRPPALLHAAEGLEPASVERFAILVVEWDGTAARLLSTHVADGPLKLKARAPENGLLVAVRDDEGRVLVLWEIFDARFEAHGDEPDPASGTLRSTSRPLDVATFAVKAPLVAGAHDVTLFERISRGGPWSGEDLARLAAAGSAELARVASFPLPIAARP